MNFTHLLITRPEAESVQLAELLANTGLEAIVLPAYRFEPAYPGFDFAGAWHPGRRRLAIFSSTRAVDFGLRQLPAGFLDEVQIAAIGPATADVLENAGHAVSVLPDGGFNSEALLEHPEMSSDSGDAIIFAAPGGRDTLRRGLENLGWNVQMALVYRRVELDPSDAQLGQLERAGKLVSVWTSANTIRLLKSRLPAAAWRKIRGGACVATSQRLKRKLETAGARNVIVTDGPGNAAIRDGILNLI